MSRAERVLDVRGVQVGTEDTPLLQDVTFALDRGERVGLIGESGSGKSLTALTVMGLLPEGVRAAGQVLLGGPGGTQDLLQLSERALSRVRGNAVSMVFQEPMTALNPTMRVGAQVAEVMLVHRTQPSRAAARARAVDLLARCDLPDPGQLARAYPHQLSGGQRQRVVLAIALANDPALLVCDEPTTALDVTVQARVLDLVVRGVRERDAAMLFITHDLAVVAAVCERVLVMYGGRIVEAGPVRTVFADPRHRYTQGLIAASDLAGAHGRRERASLPTIPGSVPPAGRFPQGCVFRTRCGHAGDACATLPPWTPRGDGTMDERAAGYACVHPAGGGPGAG